MSYAGWLAHTCTIQRVAPVTNSYGADTYYWNDTDKVTSWTESCRLVVKAERVPLSELAEKPVITTYTLLLLKDTALLHDDRVYNIVDEDGVSLGGPFKIEAILPRRAKRLHHVSALLELWEH